MAARAYWKGQIRLALVSIPVEIFSATKSGAQVQFNQMQTALTIQTNPNYFPSGSASFIDPTGLEFRTGALPGGAC